MLRTTIIAAVSGVIALAAADTARGDEWVELGFETGAVGTLPDGWFVPTAGWQGGLTAEHADQGERALKLSPAGESPAPFGNVMRSEPAGRLAGRQITLEARIRVEGAGRGQMWLRVDRRGGSMGAFDNMGDRPIVAGDWQDAVIEAYIDPDAATLNIGFMSTGGAATLYIDRLRMKVSPDERGSQVTSPAAPLTPRELEHAVAATKLLGYVRFFHPSDQAVGVQAWDHVAVGLIERAIDAKNADALATALQEIITPLAPTVQVWAGTAADAPPPPPTPAQATRLVRWKHNGVGSISELSAHQIYRSTVESVDLGEHPGGIEADYIVEPLGGGVTCRVPLALFADDDGTLPHGTTPNQWTTPGKLTRLTVGNRATRLAGVAHAWNVFQHFYPYFDVVETDWDAALPSALAEAAEAADEQAYLFVLRRLVAQLHDGHGNVFNQTVRPGSRLPLALEWAGDDLVVVGVHDSAASKVAIGDVVLSIDGRPIAECYAELGQYISAATDGWRRSVSARMLVSDLATEDPAELVLRSPAGEQKSVALDRVATPTPNTATTKRPENGAEVAPGIAYFNLDRAGANALTEAMPKLTKARAIVFDLRGYPADGATWLIQYLVDEPVTSAQWCVPIVRRPDRVDIEWNVTGRWHLAPLEPHLDMPVAFLTDGRAISYAESIMGIVEHYQLGEIVGATTAGTNGNVNPFTLPGGYSIVWTGMKVLKHDGSQHHGVGIAPTVPVTPTAAGIAAGRDEVLEQAVDVLQAKLNESR